MRDKECTMVQKEESREAFSRLSSRRPFTFGKESEAVTLRPIDFGFKVHCSTIVYQGDQFIPQSVRSASSTPLQEPQKTIHPWLSVNEQHYQISLHYIFEFFNKTADDLHDVVSQFEDTAIKWREIFEEHDRQDLVHIPIQHK